MPNRLNIKVVQEKLIKINSNIEILSDNYNNNLTPLKCECLIDGYEWETNWANLSQGHGCPKCAMLSTKNKLKKSLSEVKNIFINKGYYPLFDEYNKNSDRLLCKTQEGYLFLMSFACLQREHNPDLFSKSNPYTPQNINNWLNLNNKNFNLVSSEYYGSKINLIFNCKIHGIFECTWHSIITGSNCPKCSIISRQEKLLIYNIDIVKEKLKIINPNIELLSNEYINVVSKLQCKCLIDGHIWGITWDKLQQEQGCPKCFRRNNSGENHPNWKGGITKLNTHLRNLMNPWKIESFKKYDYKCFLSNEGGALEVHHVYNFSKIVEESLKITNLPIHKEIKDYTYAELNSITKTCLDLHYQYGLGIPMKKHLHKIFHFVYGKENNTIEQINEFKQLLKTQ